MPKDFRRALKSRPIVFDGATGTMLQRLGLPPGGCPDELNITRPELVKKVHLLYKGAGSDVVTTNTFGANRIKLKEYGLEKRVKEINIKAVKTAKETKAPFIAGCIGPTGRFIEPVGDLSFDGAVDVFSEQALALKEGGADLFIIETFMDLKELKAAIVAAKEAGLPAAATMTFDGSLRTVLGTTPEAFAVTADSLGVVACGANCSLGVEGIHKAVSRMAKVTALPLIAQPNAGIPVLKGKETVFPQTPAEFVSYVDRLVATGVRILGGCCGTTPEHIKAIEGEFRALKPEPRKSPPFTYLSSRTSHLAFGGGRPAIVAGERINPTGRKNLAEEIREGKTSIIRAEAKEQAEAGASALDVNVGVPGADEPPSMKRAVFCVNETTALPIFIDSSSPQAVEEGLKSCDGKPLINSVSGEEKKLKSILPLVKKYGAAVLALALDDKGIPPTAEGRLKAAEKILKRALTEGIKREDIVVDCLALTVGADPKGAKETLKAIRLVKEKLGLSTILGVSNISFGLPSREAVNASFLSMALEAGLDCAIINPKSPRMMDGYHSSLVLLGWEANTYIARFAGKKPEKPAEGKKPAGIKQSLIDAVVTGDEENITALVEKALVGGWPPLKISAEGLIAGLDEVGRLFASGRYFLPQVILSAETVKKGFTRLKKELKGERGPTLGTVVMATVEGDIHDIGKNIVTTLLENHGFDVIDLGKNVPAEKIVETARTANADVVGLSALMTTTVMEMDNVVKKLKEKGVKVKTIVGGAVVTLEFAKKIGAEYGGEATVAVEKIKRLVGRDKSPHPAK